MGSEKIEKQLLDANIAITNGIEDPFIRSALEPFEYTLSRMHEGKALLETAEVRVRAHRVSKYQQGKAWEALQTLWREGLDQYRLYRVIARQAVRGKSDLAQSLGLGVYTKKTLSGFLDQARVFYTNALKDKTILNALAGFGVKAKALRDAAKQLEKIEKAKAAHKRKKAETHLALKKRDQAVFELKEWMIPYWSICRLALAGHPGQLRKLRYK